MKKLTLPPVPRAPLLLLPALLVVSLLGGCSGPTPVAAVPSVAGGARCDYQTTADAARKVDPPSAAGVANTGAVTYTLKLNTDQVAVTLDREKAPCTVNSFISLAKQGFYDSTACHRLVDDGGLFVLQCGDPTGTGSGGPGYQFADELSGGEGYPAGTLAMANAGVGTNGSQFFVVYGDSQLPPDYTVFGHTDAAGIKVLATLAAGGQDGSFGQSGGGKPLLPAMIKGVVAS